MAEALHTKYRPQDWSSVYGQDSVKKVLQKQIETGNIRNSYLFVGNSGCGKTTLARLFANKVNNGQGSPIEIDAASNSGVENVRNIIATASERALDCKYKVIILDEAHAFSSQSWQAFLKCIEEPPTYTIFIFCTTEVKKIPQTIINRVQKFNFTRIKTSLIKERLDYICRQENFYNYDEATDYISKLSNGGMRLAISLLDKCAGSSKDLSIQNVLSCLGEYSQEKMFDLINAFIDGDEKAVISQVEGYYDNGNEMQVFVDKLMSFTMNVLKYAIFKDVSMTMFTSSDVESLNYITNIENAVGYYNYVLDKLVGLHSQIKGIDSQLSTVEIYLLQICRVK